MAPQDIALQRLHNQGIARSLFTRPEDVVRWLGAVQAQDYAAAKWAVGLRLSEATDAALEQACAAGTLLRTHVMRPTWHFVLPADIRWLLTLTAPRVKATMVSMNRKLELDDAVFAQSNAVLVKTLQGGKQRTRTELASALQLAGIVTDGLRLTNIMMRAELDGIVCSGARQGKQFTYALLSERAPQTSPLTHEEALAELVRRYFIGHGPATLNDFVWWSGLTVAEGRTGLTIVESLLTRQTIDGQTYWFAHSAPPQKIPSPTASLLPNYDEYLVGYADRRAAFDGSQKDKLDSRGNIISAHTIVLDGRVIGTWKRIMQKDTLNLIMSPFAPLNEAERSAILAAAERYGAFYEQPLHVSLKFLK